MTERTPAVAQGLEMDRQHMMIEHHQAPALGHSVGFDSS
jgi:hypothetical protein